MWLLRFVDGQVVPGSITSITGTGINCKWVAEEADDAQFEWSPAIDSPSRGEPRLIGRATGEQAVFQ